MTGGIDIDALKAALAAAEAKASDAAAEIAFLRLTIEKLRRELYGWRSERKSRLLDQLELQLDELEASATEDELAAEQTVAGTTEVKGFTRRKPARKPFPAHLPRERVVVPPPTSCACCGSDRLSKICGSDRGGVRAAAMYTLIGTAKLNNVDPQAWLADGLVVHGDMVARLAVVLPARPGADAQGHQHGVVGEVHGVILPKSRVTGCGRRPSG